METIYRRSSAGIVDCIVKLTFNAGKECRMKEKNTIFTDFKTAANLFGELRRARKNGSEVRIQRTIQVPYVNLGAGFLDTVEGCTLIHCGKDVFERVLEVFSGLPYEQKHCLVFAPKDGEFISRA